MSTMTSAAAVDSIAARSSAAFDDVDFPRATEDHRSPDVFERQGQQRAGRMSPRVVEAAPPSLARGALVARGR